MPRQITCSSQIKQSHKQCIRSNPTPLVYLHIAFSEQLKLCCASISAHPNGTFHSKDKLFAAQHGVSRCAASARSQCMPRKASRESHLADVRLAPTWVICSVLLMYNFDVRVHHLLHHFRQLQHGKFCGISDVKWPRLRTVHDCHHTCIIVSTLVSRFSYIVTRSADKASDNGSCLEDNVQAHCEKLCC